MSNRPRERCALREDSCVRMQTPPAPLPPACQLPQPPPVRLHHRAALPRIHPMRPTLLLHQAAALRHFTLKLRSRQCLRRLRPCFQQCYQRWQPRRRRTCSPLRQCRLHQCRSLPNRPYQLRHSVPHQSRPLQPHSLQTRTTEEVIEGTTSSGMTQSSRNRQDSPAR